MLHKYFRKSFLLIVVLLLIASTACNLGGGANQTANTSPNEAEQAEPADNSAGQEVSNSEPAENESAQVEEPPALEDIEDQPAITFSSSDPCQIVTQEQAEAALGQGVDSVVPTSDATTSSCTYFAIPGEKFITVAVWEGENAKNYFVNEIAQLSDGCNLSFSFSTDAGEPTPFPEEYQALLDETIPALFQMDMENYETCQFGYEPVPEFGPTANSFFTFIDGGLVGIATEDQFVTFLYFDSSQDIAASFESVLGLLRILFPQN